LKLRIANRPAGNTEKIISETAAVIAKATLNRANKLGIVNNHGRHPISTASEQTEAQNEGAMV